MTSAIPPDRSPYHTSIQQRRSFYLLNLIISTFWSICFHLDPNFSTAALVQKFYFSRSNKNWDAPKVECLRAIATLKQDRARVSILSGFVDSYLKLDRLEVAEFVGVASRNENREVASIKIVSEKEQVMQIVTSWMKQGIEQGEQNEARRLVLRVLNRRVGELDAVTGDRLEGLSVPQLEELLDAALDFQGMDELTAWLDFDR